MITIATPQIEAVIDRLSTDRVFRAQYCKDPEGTLGAYHLTPEEIRAIKTGDDRLKDELTGEKWEQLISALCGPSRGS